MYKRQGSIRKANNLSLVTDAAKYVQKNGGKDIKFLIFGDGDEKEVLQKKCIDEEIDNVVFKGQVEKKFIPNKMCIRDRDAHIY